MGATVKNWPLIASEPLLAHGRIQRAMAPTTTKPTAGSIHQAKAFRPVLATGTNAVGFIDITSLPLFIYSPDVPDVSSCPNPTHLSLSSTVSIVPGSNCWRSLVP